MKLFAHSTSDASRDDWEPLEEHLDEVGRRAGDFAAPFGWAQLAMVAGRLHDIGKVSAAYQAYIAAPLSDGRKGPDHSTAGAREAEALYDRQGFGRFLAYAVAGHHAGLADYPELQRRTREKALEDYAGWQVYAGELPAPATLKPTRPFRTNGHPGFSQAFLIRMLFSCLVDADFLATERFYCREERPPLTPLAELQPRLQHFLEDKRRSDTELNVLRSEVLDHAVSKAALEPGPFTLTVPTGGGKTLTSLAFALEHARRHGLDRVIYVIPYTSIIEQTAAVFREALGTDDGVLEHHASFDWDPPRRVEDADDEGQKGLSKLRRAAENWDAPVVVTTAVQFFESLFARRTSSCRKLHNIANAVVVLDEAQTLPLRLLRPCMAALNELATNYRTSVVLCTATQPALRTCDGFTDKERAPKQGRQKIGFDIDDSRELAPDPERLYTALKRVDVVRRGAPGEKTPDAKIVERFAEQPQMLCIVNSRRHARDLFDALRADGRTVDGVRHLSTLMCPVHRRAVLSQVKAGLLARRPVRLVATSLVEAGVDVDFPEVWRAVAGLDSIAQAAGRCNREGRLEERGRTVVFEPAEGKPPKDLRSLIECAEGVFRDGLDPLSLEGVKRYFGDVYWRGGPEAMDAATLDGAPWPILEKVCERVDPSTGECTFDFETIARVFRMIDDEQATVIVPYDGEAEAILARVAAMERPAVADLRKLQQYAVSIPRSDRDLWLTTGALHPVHGALGAALLRFEDVAHYRHDTGVDLQEPERRDAAANII